MPVRKLDLTYDGYNGRDHGQPAALRPSLGLSSISILSGSRNIRLDWTSASHCTKVKEAKAVRPMVQAKTVPKSVEMAATLRISVVKGQG